MVFPEWYMNMKVGTNHSNPATKGHKGKNILRRQRMAFVCGSHQAVPAMTATSCLLKAIGRFPFMPNAGGNHNEGNKLPSSHAQSARNRNEGIKLPSQGNELPSFGVLFRRRLQRRHKVAFSRQSVAQTRHGFALFTASTPKTG
jgi:hypothetical protein